MQSYYDMLPDNIRSRFEATDWVIEVVAHDDLNNMVGIGKKGWIISGATVYKHHKILISDRKEGHCDVLHEIGHWTDKTLGVVFSDTPEFKRIFAEEGSKYTEYGSTNSAEFFGEIFEGLILEPDKVIKKCPQAAAFVMGVMSGV